MELILKKFRILLPREKDLASQFFAEMAAKESRLSFPNLRMIFSAG